MNISDAAAELAKVTEEQKDSINSTLDSDSNIGIISTLPGWIPGSGADESALLDYIENDLIDIEDAAELEEILINGDHLILISDRPKRGQRPRKTGN